LCYNIFMNQLHQFKKDLAKLGSPKKAKAYQWFFKTGPGEYGAGDEFLGLTSAETKSVARKYADLSLGNIQTLLKSQIHEQRMVALRILMGQYESLKKMSNRYAALGSASDKKILKQFQDDMYRIYKFYLSNSNRINSWDLVDVSAPYIVGDFLLDKPRQVLYKLARSKNLWSRRISILATYSFIRNNDYKDTLKISQLLLQDEHDLMHKAVGWMLREVGKRDQPAEEEFLIRYHKVMPRTMLRYAIERLPEKKRKFYMGK
jgi:3-methyladenine DNA glycosylase AlkD